MIDMLKGKVLIVDDSAVVRKTLRYGLEIHGHHVAEANNGVEAFTKLWLDEYDLIFLDVEMPQMNGYEVLQKLQLDPNLAHIPVIVISGNEDIKSTVRCIELGAVDYLNKPFNSTLLNARVKSSLAQKKLRDRELKQRQELEHLYLALKQADEAKDEFVAMVAHDLRNPINGLLAGHQILTRLNDDEKQLAVLDNMEISLDSLRMLVNDLNDVSRIENHNIGLEYSEVDLGKLIGRVIGSLRHKSDQKAQTIAFDMAEKLPFVYGDQFRMMQILTNLVSNAVKYTQENGRIHITAHPYALDPAMVHVTVEDNGIGMEQAAADHIFDKYYRAENDDTKKEDGIGLGMFITKNLIQTHGGNIWIKSERHRGTIVHFTLPLVQEDEWANRTNNDTFSPHTMNQMEEEQMRVPTD